MGVRRLRLSGFETELAGAIASGYRFPDPSIMDLPLVVDRNIFAMELPAPEEIAAGESTFDPNREPTIAIYRQPGRGIEPTASSGGRLGFNLLLVLRAPRALQVSVDWLGDLVVWLELNAVGLITPSFKITGFQTLGMPVPAERLSNDMTKASASVRFLAIARN